MFTITRQTGTYALTGILLPVDSLHQQYAFDGLTIQAGQVSDTLSVPGLQASIRFDDDVFPLSGAAYLTAVTGTLRVTVTQALAQGVYRVPFVSGVQGVPVAGFALDGVGPVGLSYTIGAGLSVALLVPSFAIPAVTLPGATGTSPVRVVPVLTG